MTRLTLTLLALCLLSGIIGCRDRIGDINHSEHEAVFQWGVNRIYADSVVAVDYYRCSCGYRKRITENCNTGDTSVAYWLPLPDAAYKTTKRTKPKGCP